MLTINLRLLAQGAAVALIGFGALGAWQQRAVSHGPGVVAPDPPQQRVLAAERRLPFAHKRYQITPLAEFSLAARVLGNERFRFDGGADIAPLDLAFAWGPMSDETLLQHVEFDHGGRWLSWYPQESSLPPEQIANHVANVHIIPASDTLAKRLHQVRVGQVVELRGSLVEVRDGGHLVWASSLSRDDDGKGACEVFYVEQFELLL